MCTFVAVCERQSLRIFKSSDGDNDDDDDYHIPEFYIQTLLDIITDIIIGFLTCGFVRIFHYK